MTKIKQYWTELHSSFWFIPTVIVFMAIILAVGLIQVDIRVGENLAARWPNLFGAGADGSRGMLSAIAGSMITVAGVTFSITIAALSLASTQYSPRILRHFMRDRANQAVLGVFVGIFAYCLIVLRTIRGGEEGRFVPELSVFFSLILALIGVGFLIFFIHHVSNSIHSSSIVAAAASQTTKAIDRLFPQELGQEEPEVNVQEEGLDRLSWQPIPVKKSGYIQNVDAEDLLNFACEHQVVLRMERGIGDFVVEGSKLVSLVSSTPLNEETIKKLNGLYTINRHRTVEQDAAFGLQQIVDIAVKALSPGINDPTTAIICLDYLSDLLSRLAQRSIETPYRQKEGKLKLIAEGPTFESLVDVALNSIRQNASGQVAVIIRMIQTIETVAVFTDNGHRRQILLKHLYLVKELVEESISSSYDRARVDEYFIHAKNALEK